MDKITLSTPYTSKLEKAQRLKFTKYLGTKGVGENGSLRITSSMDVQTEVVLKCRPNGISLTFNPSKYYFGKNVEQVNLKQLTEVVEQLSEYYGTDLKEWNVSSFDYCENISLNHGVEHYINMFGNLKGRAPNGYGKTGKTYTNKSNTKSLTMYNKLDEMKGEQPEDETNILRIEIGINKSPHNYKLLLNMKTLNDYLLPENFAKLPQLWVEMLKEIETNERFTTFQPLTEREQTLVLYLDKFGWEDYRKKLRVDFKKSPKTLQRRLKELDNLQTTLINQTPTSLVKELYDKANEKVNVKVCEPIAAASI